MNLVKNSSMKQQQQQQQQQRQLREDEALVVENAIRLAIDSIVNVLFGVRSGRNRELQVMVADRDQQIQRLEGRLAEIEQELRVMRRQGCGCGLPGAPGAPGSGLPGAPGCGEREAGRPSRGHPESGLTAGSQESELSISFGAFARPPSHVSSQSQESAVSSSPNRLVQEQSHMSDLLCGPESISTLSHSPSNVVIKEEPCDVDAILIKWEMTDEQLGDQQEAAGALCGDGFFGKNLPEAPCEFVQAENSSGGHGSAEPELLRNKKRNTPMSELTEEAQRLKRAAWREASRRYYARKVARQQATPRHNGLFQHLGNSGPGQTISLGESKRRRIHELPRDTQEHQREVWRAASRRYYAHKTARHQTTPQQYGNFLHGVEPSEESSERSGGGPNGSGGGGGGGLGGIMCS